MFRQKLQQFFYGRNGPDQLGLFLMVLSIPISLVNHPAFTVISWILISIVVFRMLSKNVVKRRKENIVFMKFWNAAKKPFQKLKARYNERKFYKIFRCPKCRQKLRVPRYKGTVKVRCSKCGNAFVKKT